MRRLLCPLLVCLAGLAHADVDQQGWFQLTLNKRTPQGWRYFGEVQERIGQGFSRPTQFLGRVAVGRQLSPEFSLWLGYGWTPTISPAWRSEDRYFAQGLWETRPGNWSVANRTRLEFRQIARTGGTSVRLRHLVRGTTPLRPGRPEYVAVQNELFYNFNSLDNGPRAGFEQNRLFVGLGTRLSPKFRIEAGYQPVFFWLPTDRRLDTLLVSANLDF